MAHPPRLGSAIRVTDPPGILMAMNLQSLRELVEISTVTTEPTKRVATMRVSGGMYGPDRAFNERLSFYGQSAFAITYPGSGFLGGASARR
jgi:hypothetical protein